MKKRLILSVLLTAFLCGSSAFSQTKVIAHRGYWDCEGSAQNSITALNKAHEVGVYGSEFDVLITADGIPVVNHNDSIQGFCIETSLYEEIKDLKLKNGEVLPTLEDYLIQGKQNKGTQLILEIKPHKRVVNEDRAVTAILALVQKYQLEDHVEYISFSMNICKELIRRAPAAQVAYLRGEVSPADLKVLGFTGLDYHYKVFEKNPTWIQEAKNAGLTVNVWTVDDPAVMQSMIEQNVDFITTDKPEQLKEIVKKN
ncbi:glycerophosphodiester phosphodiesterase family protein [Parabacteroides sp. TM07-1AC]|jgi:glycerophosphoryl diester phosphodiesterase|uniref:glycerophosphodiester phosphodiesterase family protein n=1 Tax=Parabacteroides sp. TM07-1AC TaxID=2292363 RepID=UPI000EFFC012|nr:glycerophosphodiester phosphodiesterase family protein [Parabacteroides sp. TM07-1AC]RHU22044.1 glycerophosphodiester phosphodiesterase [Parabacteroides sp. TM07-1AC]